MAENDIDIATFSEHEGINFKIVEEKLGNKYKYIEGVQDDGKVALVAKNTYIIEVLQQQHRYSIYGVKTAMKDYILSVIHLEDRRNFERADRMNTIQSLINDIGHVEEMFQCSNTIVIGDFNANPYDEELLSIYAFNAVLFKSIINKSEIRRKNTTEYKRFYNPVLHYISEETEMYGSFYYENGSKTPYWCCLDQILIRKDLINYMENMQYLKKIETTNLLKSIKPNETISDHLPLLVNFSEVENED